VLYALAAEQLDAAGFAVGAGTTQPRVQLHALTCTPVSRGKMIDRSLGVSVDQKPDDLAVLWWAAVPWLAGSLHILQLRWFLEK